MFKEKVITPRAEDLLLIDENELENLEQIPIHRSESIKDSGNIFTATCAPTTSYAQVRNAYKKIASDPNYAGASHRILAYRFKDSNKSKL